MSPLLERGYLFSQHSLNTFLRCRRRFLLKYVDRQPWPMPEEEDPLEYAAHLARGRVFHQWLLREHLGLDVSEIVAASDDALLQRWWAAYQTFDHELLPSDWRQAELPIVVPLGAYRLYARYDLLALDMGGDAVIVDWKTLETVPPRRILTTRVQTRVYLYTLVAAGQVLSGGPRVDPDRASMLYWFANYPEETVRIPYSRRAHQQAARDLRRLVEEIAALDREAFDRSEDARQCARCNYRSLCGRDQLAALPSAESWLDEDIDFDLDIEQAPELEY